MPTSGAHGKSITTMTSKRTTRTSAPVTATITERPGFWVSAQLHLAEGELLCLLPATAYGLAANIEVAGEGQQYALGVSARSGLVTIELAANMGTEQALELMLEALAALGIPTSTR